MPGTKSNRILSFSINRRGNKDYQPFKEIYGFESRYTVMKWMYVLP